MATEFYQVEIQWEKVMNRNTETYLEIRIIRLRVVSWDRAAMEITAKWCRRLQLASCVATAMTIVSCVMEDCNENGRVEHRTVRDFLILEKVEAAEGEETASFELSKAESYDDITSLGLQRIRFCLKHESKRYRHDPP